MTFPLDHLHAAFCAGREYGCAEGQRMAVEHLAAELLHHRAAEVVSFVSTLPERDHEADREAADRREARWSS